MPRGKDVILSLSKDPPALLPHCGRARGEKLTRFNIHTDTAKVLEALAA
ncbi:MAG TPA: hypothetical protein VGU20_02380 [Stellaceae bacterium]|nr:hypothetical protein [Stellaceae bacterium]